MGKFVKVFEIKKEFEGDSIVFRAAPITTVDMFSLIKDGGDNVSREYTPDETTKIINLFGKYLEDITGVRDATGNAVQKEEVMRAAYFFPLVTEAATDWIAMCMPHMDGAKVEPSAS